VDFLRNTLSMIPLLASGIPMVLNLTVYSLILAVVVGLILSLVRIAHVPFLNQVVVVIVELLRGTPLLVQLVYIYYVFPVIGIHIDPVVSGILGLGLNYAAYVSEVFRSSINSIDRGQMEAALSLGYTPPRAMAKIIIPQSLRVSVPPLGNYAISMVKDTALTSVIAVTEILKQANVLASTTFQVTEAYTAAAILYLVISLPLSGLVKVAEWRVNRNVAK
jgi:His/Glu/Gln/Arg/opine family amino acid ABC transporter permease subunit